MAPVNIAVRYIKCFGVPVAKKFVRKQLACADHHSSDRIGSPLGNYRLRGAAPCSVKVVPGGSLCFDSLQHDALRRPRAGPSVGPGIVSRQNSQLVAGRLSFGLLHNVVFPMPRSRSKSWIA